MTISVVLPVIKSSDPNYISGMKNIRTFKGSYPKSEVEDKIVDDKHMSDCIFKKLETEMTNHLEDVKTMDERGHTKNFDESADDKDHDPSQDIIKRSPPTKMSQFWTGGGRGNPNILIWSL